MARLDQTTLAKASGVSLETVKRLEAVRGEASANIRTMSAILGALAKAGVVIERRPDGGICVCHGPSPRPGAPGLGTASLPPG